LAIGEVLFGDEAIAVAADVDVALGRVELLGGVGAELCARRLGLLLLAGVTLDAERFISQSANAVVDRHVA